MNLAMRDRVSSDELRHDLAQQWVTDQEQKQAARNVKARSHDPVTLEAVYEQGIPYATCMKIAQALKTGQAVLMLPAIQADVEAYLEVNGELYES